MAQSKVTFYYGSRKRSSDIQSSKRRKLTRIHSNDSETSTVFSESKLAINNTPVFSFNNNGEHNVVGKTGHFPATGTKLTKAAVADQSPMVSTRPRPCSNNTTHTRSTRRKTSQTGRKQRIMKKGESEKATGLASIRNYISTVSVPTSQEEAGNIDGGLHSTSDVELHFSDSSSEASGPTFAITEAHDDHTIPRTPPTTPTKRAKTLTELPVARKRSKPFSKEESQSQMNSELESGQPRSLRVAGRISAKKCLNGALAKFSVEMKLLDDSTKITNSEGHAKGSPSASILSGPMGESRISKPTASKTTPMTDKVEDMIKRFAASREQITTTTVCKKVAKSSAEVMREKLAKCGKLEELQRRLAAVREEPKRKEQEAAAVREEPKKKDQETQKLVKKYSLKSSKNKNPGETATMPAYEKYHSLASPPSATLSLPYKYKTLHEMFRNMDTIVSMLHNRSERCTFKKLKDAVQEMCRKTFQLNHVGQIKKVYSTAYTFSQRKITAQQQRDRSKGESDYELHIDANITPRDADGTMNKSGQPRMTASAIVERRQLFHNRLVDIVKGHHKEFLSRLAKPLTVPDKELKRWHPKFPLDQVPDIQADILPEPPNIQKYNTAKDVLEKAKNMMSPRVMSPRVSRALELVAENSDKFKNECNKQKGNDSKLSTTKTDNLNGVSKSLLDRIRAKEAKKIEQMLIRDPRDDQRLAMMERLPELCGIIRNVFLSEKKAALPIESAVKKLKESSRSGLSQVEAEEHIKLLTDVLPDWIKVIHIRNEKYLKIDKNKELNQVNLKVKQLIKDCK